MSRFSRGALTAVAVCAFALPTDASAARIELNSTRSELRSTGSTQFTYVAEAGEVNRIGVSLRSSGPRAYLRVIDASNGTVLEIVPACAALGRPATRNGRTQRVRTPVIVECQLTRAQQSGSGSGYLFGASLGDKEDGASLRLPSRNDAWLAGGRDADILMGGSGDDVLCSGDYSGFVGPNNLTARRRIPDCQQYRADLPDVSTMHGLAKGGDGDDQLFGTMSGESFDGGDGSDRVFAQDGDDQLSGGPGTDYLYAGAGDDWLDQPMAVVTAGAQERQIVPGNDYLYGESGDDTAGYQWINTSVRASPSGAGTASGADRFDGIERFELGNGNDSWTGTRPLLAIHVNGNGGDDQIDVAGNAGLWGSDSIDCGDGSDRARIDGRRVTTVGIPSLDPIYTLLADGQSNCEQLDTAY